MHRSLSRSLRHGAVLVGFALLSFAMTWPLGGHLGTHVVRAKWYYDSMVNLHILGSRVHYALGMSPGLKSIYDNYFCAPTPFSIANNENHFGLSLLFAPFYVVTGDPLHSYNLLLLTCLSLSAFFTYLLVRELTESALAGVLSGIAFAFCPYVFFELGRVQLVATQWIPLFALFLHRTATNLRTRDLLGLAFSFVMQVGSCLYYALFLVVYALLVGTWLMLRHRSIPRRFLLSLVATSLVAGTLVLAMVYPNFRAKRDFDLTRSAELAARYAGKLEDLAAVYPENKALSFLHHRAEGPTEPIAFPGFTLLLLSTIALLAPIGTAYRSAPPEARRKLLIGIALSLLGATAGIGISLIAHTFLLGLLLVVVLIVWWRRIRTQPLLPPLTAIYVTLFALSLLLFLGPAPFVFNGSPVQGLYDYLYRYLPGFDGIRYVNRFSILMMIALAVLGGFGAALLLKRPLPTRSATFVVLLVAMLLELRNAPLTLAQLPSRSTLPAVYHWLAKHPGPEPIATMPAYSMGYFGARNDYFALFHRRRTIDGKSSWMPPITHAFIQESRRFPRGTATQMLRALGVKYLVLHLEEFSALRRRRIIDWLDKRPLDYKKRFGAGTQVIYEVLPSTNESFSLLPMPRLPPGAALVPTAELSASASNDAGLASLALDGDPDTKWTTNRFQAPGDFFEIGLQEPRSVAAIEFTDVREAFETPSAYKISVANPDGSYQTVMTRPMLRFYRDQVFHPKTFIFRAVLPKPVVIDSIRIELLDGVAGRRWTIHETNVWALP